LLQTSDGAQAKRPEVSRLLAKEYLQWQTMRVRQLFDFLQEQVTQKIATQEVVAAYSAEISSLADFPSSLLQAAGVKAPGSLPGPVKWSAGSDPKQNSDLVAAWRVYGMIDQELMHSGGRSVGMFFRAGGSPHRDADSHGSLLPTDTDTDHWQLLYPASSARGGSLSRAEMRDVMPRTASLRSV
jgi:hypothetical protein